MKTRIISGVIIAALTIVLGIVGGLPLGIVLMICSMIAYYELTRALGVFDPDRQSFNALVVVGLAVTAVYYIMMMAASQTEVVMVRTGNIFTRGPEDATPFIEHADSMALVAIIAVFLIDMAIYVLTYPHYDTSQVLGAIFSFIYAPLMISCVFRSVYLPYGFFVYAIIFFCSWISDTCAWAVGRAIGRHKMTPILSPHKTVEGAIGGIAGAVILCVAAAGVVEVLSPGANVYVPFGILGLFGSLLGMVGDLAASAIKRHRGIKDYGHIIPGHGGIMDRFDSVIFTAPAIYLLGMLLLALL